MDTKRQVEIFNALPLVDEIWITSDGNFHLHPHNGGERVAREEVIQEAKVEKLVGVPLKKAIEVIELINAATTAEEVQDILGTDVRVSVKAAADKKIASL